jgi:hypothetical protein
MKRSVIAVLSVALLVLVGTTAQASVSWQTTPILGYSSSSVTGDLVVITGPTPTKPGGGYYYDVDGNIVLGPTIPHYSMVGDPLYQVGSPSVSLFYINPTAWDSGSGHFYDPNVWVYSGSGVYLDTANTYHYTGVYSFLGTPGNPAYDVVAAENLAFSGAPGFIMLSAGLGWLWPEDAGHWKYTETWTDNMDGVSISASRDFDVKLVPEPATIIVWSLLGMAVVGYRAWQRKRAA